MPAPPAWPTGADHNELIENEWIVWQHKKKNGGYKKLAWSAASTLVPDARSIQLTDDSAAAVNNIMLDTDRRRSLWSVLRPGREVWISECVDPLFYYWWDQDVGVCKAQAQSNNRDLAISTSCSSDQSGSYAGHLRFYSWSSKANESSGKSWKICRSPPIHFQWTIYNEALQPAATYLSELLTYNQTYQEGITVMVLFRVFPIDIAKFSCPHTVDQSWTDEKVAALKILDSPFIQVFDKTWLLTKCHCLHIFST